MTTVNTLPYYTFGSPRYHAITNATTLLIPEDYSYHDSTLGTYDMNFPLYSISESPIPTTQLLDQSGTFSNVKGCFAPFLGQSAYKTKIIGKTGTRSIPTNSNLDLKEVQYDEYLNIKLNPAWCVIQNYSVSQGTSGSITQIPQYVIRILGNTLLSQQLYAMELKDSALGILTSTFPLGIIVNYKNNLWKCIADTTTYPPDTASDASDYWTSMYGKFNVFSADIFMFSDTNTTYLKEINDSSRSFNPAIIDDTLVSWNLAYWEG